MLLFWAILKNDFFQKKSRKLVLFGHTIGQSIESLSLETKTPLLHGEALSIGLLAEVYLSHLKYNIPYSEVEQLKKRLLAAGLPISTTFSRQNIRRKMLLDKKNILGELNWTLINKIGNGIYDVKVDENLVNKALSYICRN